jgi:hypothetical protein
MNYREYTGKRVTTECAMINGVGVKLPIYERDVIEASLKSKGVSLVDLLSGPYHDMSCDELKALVK